MPFDFHAVRPQMDAAYVAGGCVGLAEFLENLQPPFIRIGDTDASNGETIGSFEVRCPPEAPAAIYGDGQPPWSETKTYPEPPHDPNHPPPYVVEVRYV